MAEITATSLTRSKRRRLRHAQMDMTPLVDLGFLLITFFMLTTHLIDQRVMNLVLPLPGPATAANNTLTILLDEKGRRYGYQGEFNATTQLQPLEGRSLRNTLSSFRALSEQVQQDPVCLVKVNDGVRYQSVVSTLDEIQHANIARLSIVDSITRPERELLTLMRANGTKKPLRVPGRVP